MSFVSASGLHATIQSKTLAAIVDKYKDEIRELGLSGEFDSPVFVTINQDQVTLEQDVLDIELPCPESLDDLVFCLIELFGDEDVMVEITGQIMDEGVDPSDLDVDEFGPLGKLYRELCQKKDAILSDIQNVKWEVSSGVSEVYDSSCAFSYDPVNGESFEGNDADWDEYDEEEDD